MLKLQLNIFASEIARIQFNYLEPNLSTETVSRVANSQHTPYVMEPHGSSPMFTESFHRILFLVWSENSNLFIQEPL